MKQKRVPQMFAGLMLSSFLQISGCANTGSDNADRNLEQPTMGRKGQGRHQGPPEGDRNAKKTEQENVDIPVEAFTACEEKLSGDVVTFVGSRGETIKATCQEYHDHLVAVPDKGKAKDSHHSY